jgi:predicted TIM-barrel fold metal-dependent hydrolase
MASLVNEYKVIDSDTHIVEPYDLWTSRISVPQYGDKVPHVKWDEEKKQDFWFFGSDRTHPAAWAGWSGWHEYPPNSPARFSETDPATWCAKDRLKRMDEYGIHAQILYPNVAGFGAGMYLCLEDPKLMLLCVQAYNNWLVEWASAAPDRLLPQMALPFWDIDLSIAEMTRAAKLGHKGIVFGSEPEVWGMPKIGDRHWDPIWAAAQDMHLPVNFHIGSGADLTGKDEAFLDQTAGKHAEFASRGVVFFLGNAKVITQLICSGICHRYPKLNFVSVESGVGWIPFALASLDWQWKNCGVAKEHPEYALLPNEYFKRQIYGCFWFERETLKSAIDQIGPDNILYETDFPHPTSMSPGPATTAISPRDYIQQTLSAFPKEIVAKVLHDNAAKLYNLI